MLVALPSFLIEYQEEIVRFGREWSPDSLPFRELAFALVSVAPGRRVATFILQQQQLRLPQELLDRIIDFVDYDTCKSCSVASRELRSACLFWYRLDERTRMVAGPFLRLHGRSRDYSLVMWFDLEDMKTGEVFPVTEDPGRQTTRAHNWMPVIGDERKLLMVDVMLQFKQASNLSVKYDDVVLEDEDYLTNDEDYLTDDDQYPTGDDDFLNRAQQRS